MSVLRLVFAAVLGTALAGPASAESPWLVRVSMQMLSVEPAAALPLLPRLYSAEQCEPALRELDRMLVQGRAELLDWPSMVLTAGSRTLVESTEELRYPTEFEPPQEPGGLVRRPRGDFLNRDIIRGCVTPTSFETRNIYTTMQCAAAVSNDGQRIEVELDAAFILLEQLKQLRGSRDQLGIMGYVYQPDFGAARSQTRFTVRSGTRVFCSSFAFEKPKPRVIIFVLSATAKLAEPPKSHP